MATICNSYFIYYPFVQMAKKLKLLLSFPLLPCHSHRSLPLSSFWSKTHFSRSSSTTMAASSFSSSSSLPDIPTTKSKIIDSHLHVWASPEEAVDKYPYFPGNEPTLPGNVEFLLNCMEEAGVDGALIVQPINHKFDHSLVTSVLKRYPSKFVGCCLADPAEDGSGVKQLEHLVSKDGYRAVRFNPYLWPSDQKMTNEVGKALFSKAGELGIPVGFMCMKGLSLHISEIEELCTEFPSTVVLLDHLAFCKPPANDEEDKAFSRLLDLYRFPQVYVKFSALFRVSRKPFPYEDLSHSLSQVVSTFGANRIMWGTDFHMLFLNVVIKEPKKLFQLLPTKCLYRLLNWIGSWEEQSWSFFRVNGRDEQCC